ncbi:uncharacterized protein LOC120884488 [Ictidomys tridecemlineatus]
MGGSARAGPLVCLPPRSCRERWSQWGIMGEALSPSGRRLHAAGDRSDPPAFRLFLLAAPPGRATPAHCGVRSRRSSLLCHCQHRTRGSWAELGVLGRSGSPPGFLWVPAPDRRGVWPARYDAAPWRENVPPTSRVPQGGESANRLSFQIMFLEA